MTKRMDGKTVLTRDDVWEIVRDALGLFHGEAQADSIAEVVVSDLESEGVQHDGWEAS